MIPGPAWLRHGAIVLGLLAGAWLAPGPLYLLSLAAFGLPHVIWEIGYLKNRYAARWPLWWWRVLWAILLLQAISRGALWAGIYPAASSAVADLAALLLLALLVACAPRGTGWQARLAALTAAGAILYLLQQGQVLVALLVLGIAHNFTPIALAWDAAREHAGRRRLAWGISALFALPILVAATGLIGMAPAAAGTPLLDGQLPAEWGGAQRQALLSALVLAQCLHYYAVIVLLPQAEFHHSGRQPLPPAAKRLAWLASGALLAYFVLDYGQARKLYAVAAGMHAWLEWPVLLMALLGTARTVEHGAGRAGRLAA